MSWQSRGSGYPSSGGSGYGGGSKSGYDIGIYSAGSSGRSAPSASYSHHHSGSSSLLSSRIRPSQSSGSYSGSGVADKSGAQSLPQSLEVSGCSNATVTTIIKGLYAYQGTNHGKPFYKKEGPPGDLTVLIYYWDERDGPSFRGWWFGPKVGGDQVWAYHGSKDAAAPPLNGWKVPWDGPVDDLLRISSGGVSGGSGAGVATPARGRISAPSRGGDYRVEPYRGRKEEEEDEDRRQSAGRHREEDTPPPRRGWGALNTPSPPSEQAQERRRHDDYRRRRSESEDRRLEEERIWRQEVEEHHRRLEEERRHEEEERRWRQEEEDRRQEEERRRRQDEERRRQEEERRRRQEEELRRQEEERLRREEEDRREEERRRRLEEELRRQAEERRREEERRRLEEERRREEDRKRRAAEEARRKQEETRRREEEEARKRAERKEQEMKRQEQAAALVVRKLIQRVLRATPENYASILDELKEAKAAQAQNMGSMADKVGSEVEKALEQAQERIDEINAKRAAEERNREEKRAAEEKKKVEEEKRLQEEKELCQRLLQKAKQEIEEAEKKVDEAADRAETAEDDKEALPGAMTENARAADKGIEDATKALDDAVKSLDDKRDEIRGPAVKDDINDLYKQIGDARQRLQIAVRAMKRVREKATLKAAALKKLADKHGRFRIHDVDGDGKLSQAEVAAFSLAHYQFEVPEEALKKIMKRLEPVTFEKFDRVRAMVAIEKSEIEDRKRRAAEEERRKQEEAKRQEEEEARKEQERKRRADVEEKTKALDFAKSTTQKNMKEAAELIAKAEGQKDEVERHAASPTLNGMRWGGSAPSKFKEHVSSVLASIKATCGEAIGKLKTVEEECMPILAVATSEDLQGLQFDKREIPRLKHRSDLVQIKFLKVQKSVEAIVEAASAPEAKVEVLRQEAAQVAAEKEKAAAEKEKAEKEKAEKEKAEKEKRKAYLELDAKFVTAMRALMNSEAKSGEQLFEHVGGGGEVKREKFMEFCKGLSELKLDEFKLIGSEDELIERLFAQIAGASENITKDMFLDFIRLYYTCVKVSSLTEDLSITSKTVRKLEIAEVLEVLEGPRKADEGGLQRIKVKAVNDAAVGWATIVGNQGTELLKPGGSIFKCVKETHITDGLSITVSKTVRKTVPGEVIEVMQFATHETEKIKRVKGKAREDGAIGWITVCGNQGTVYLEHC